MPDPVVATPTPTPTPAPTPTPTPAPAGDTSWYAGADAETIGHIQTRGWDKKTAAEAAVEAVRAHREAQKFIGAPPEEVVRVPKANAPADEVNAFWAKVGAPKDATGYDLSGVKDAAGNPVAADLSDAIKNAALTNHLLPNQALDLANTVQKVLDHRASEDTTVKAGKLAEDKAALAKNWGQNFEANKFVASQAAKALGFTPEAIAALENQVGYKAVMEAMLTAGQRMGEDKFVSGGDNRPGVMTIDQAKAKKADLMKDQAWGARYLAGGVNEVAEMTALNTLIANASSPT